MPLMWLSIRKQQFFRILNWFHHISTKLGFSLKTLWPLQIYWIYRWLYYKLLKIISLTSQNKIFFCWTRPLQTWGFHNILAHDTFFLATQFSRLLLKAIFVALGLKETIVDYLSFWKLILLLYLVAYKRDCHWIHGSIENCVFLFYCKYLWIWISLNSFRLITSTEFFSTSCGISSILSPFLFGLPRIT